MGLESEDSMNTECPICKRSVGIESLASNMKGEPILTWHLESKNGPRECIGSHKSITDVEHILFLQSHPHA